MLDLFKNKVTYNPYVTITKTMTNELTEKQKEIYDVVEKNYNSPEFVSQLAFQSLGKKKKKIFTKKKKIYTNKKKKIFKKKKKKKNLNK